MVWSSGQIFCMWHWIGEIIVNTQQSTSSNANICKMCIFTAWRLLERNSYKIQPKMVHQLNEGNSDRSTEFYESYGGKHCKAFYRCPKYLPVFSYLKSRKNRTLGKDFGKPYCTTYFYRTKLNSIWNAGKTSNDLNRWSESFWIPTWWSSNTYQVNNSSDTTEISSKNGELLRVINKLSSSFTW